MGRSKDTEFKPGQSGNPAGRAVEPKIYKDIRSADKFTVAEVLHKVLHMSVEELLAFTSGENLKNLKHTGLEFAAAKIMLKAASQGDHKSLEFILNRLIGRVKVEVVTQEPLLPSGGGGERKIFILPSNGREKNDDD